MVTISDLRFDDNSVPNGLLCDPEPFREYRVEIPGLSGDALAGIPFVDGVGQAPARGNAVRRLVAGYGSTMSLSRWNAEATCHEEAPEEAAPPDLQMALDEPSEEQPAATVTEEASATTPTTWPELLAMDEPALRAVAEQLGCTDKRWKAARLRTFIADELEISSPEDSR